MRIVYSGFSFSKRVEVEERRIGREIAMSHFILWLKGPQTYLSGPLLRKLFVA